MRRPITIALLFVLSACTSDPGDAESDLSEQEIRTSTVLLEAKLYSDPDADVSPDCDVHTAATLRKTSAGRFRLELENRVGGGCEIAIRPDKRAYSVTLGDDCGTKVYAGTRANASVELRDNASRLCEDVRPAVLELHEVRGGRTTHLFGARSNDAPSGASPRPVLAGVKLYDEPRATPDATCDVHTRLDLELVGDRLEARLESRLSTTSSCEIYIAPNETRFEVSESDECGSKIYRSAAGPKRIVIKDHAARRCEDVIPARVEVVLQRSGRTTYLYSAE